MTYNVFGGTLNFAQSIMIRNQEVIVRIFLLSVISAGGNVFGMVQCVDTSSICNLGCHRIEVKLELAFAAALSDPDDHC